MPKFNNLLFGTIPKFIINPFSAIYSYYSLLIIILWTDTSDDYNSVYTRHSLYNIIKFKYQ